VQVNMPRLQLETGWVDRSDYWTAPRDLVINVKVDCGHRRLEGRAREWVKHDNGWCEVRGVAWYRQEDTWGFGTDTTTGGNTNWDTYQWSPVTANAATNNLIINTGTTTGTNTNTIFFDTNGNVIVGRLPTPAEIAHTEMKQRRRPKLLNHRGKEIRSEHKGTQWSNVPPEELVALQLLRKMVSPEEFKRYLKHGFVSVKGPSGLTYQIGKHANIVVWDKDEKIATLCVHLKDWYNKPPTDEVVAKMIIAECDEPDLWKRSNTSFLTAKKDRPALQLLKVA
jgi:hypothetical protein